MPFFPPPLLSPLWVRHSQVLASLRGHWHLVWSASVREYGNNACRVGTTSGGGSGRIGNITSCHFRNKWGMDSDGLTSRSWEGIVPPAKLLARNNFTIIKWKHQKRNAVTSTRLRNDMVWCDGKKCVRIAGIRHILVWQSLGGAMWIFCVEVSDSFSYVQTSTRACYK